MCYIYLVFLVIYCALLTNAGNLLSTYMKAVAGYKLPGDNIEVKSANKVTNCVILCTRNDACNSVTYNYGTKTCTFHSETYFSDLVHLQNETESTFIYRASDLETEPALYLYLDNQQSGPFYKLMTSWPDATLKHAPIKSVKATGVASWRVFTEPNYLGRVGLVQPGSWENNQLGFCNADETNAYKLLGTSCQERPLGFQNSAVIPDSAVNLNYQGWGLPVGDASYARLYSHTILGTARQQGYNTGLATNTVEVDLGSTHMVYGIDKTSGCYCTETIFYEAYYSTWYYVEYSLDGASYTTYIKDGSQYLEGNTYNTHKVIMTEHFNPPFQARFVRVVGGGGYLQGLKLEFYGCLV